MVNNRTTIAKEEENQTAQMEQKRDLGRHSVSTKKWMLRSAIYRKTCHLTQQCSGIYLQWRAEGVVENIMSQLHYQVREQVRKKGQWTTLMIVDSQAVKNTCNASIESIGFCFYKSTNGIY